MLLKIIYTRKNLLQAKLNNMQQQLKHVHKIDNLEEGYLHMVIPQRCGWSFKEWCLSSTQLFKIFWCDFKLMQSREIPGEGRDINPSIQIRIAQTLLEYSRLYLETSMSVQFPLLHLDSRRSISRTSCFHSSGFQGRFFSTSYSL